MKTSTPHTGGGGGGAGHYRIIARDKGVYHCQYIYIYIHIWTCVYDGYTQQLDY